MPHNARQMEPTNDIVELGRFIYIKTNARTYTLNKRMHVECSNKILATRTMNEKNTLPKFNSRRVPRATCTFCVCFFLLLRCVHFFCPKKKLWFPISILARQAKKREKMFVKSTPSIYSIALVVTLISVQIKCDSHVFGQRHDGTNATVIAHFILFYSILLLSEHSLLGRKRRRKI